MAEVAEVDADGPPDLTSDPEFAIFTRGTTKVALFRRDRIQSVYELPTGRVV